MGYPPAIEYLEIKVDANSPNQDGWENYQTNLSFFPNLKGVKLHMIPENQVIEVDLETVMDGLSAEDRNIWEDRISYLESKGIILMNREQYESKVKELCKQIQWGFQFYPVSN